MVVELGRIEVSALDRPNRPRHIAIPRVRNAGQGGGELEQECVAIARLQRPACAEDVG
jgi:hypothetical protein